MSYAANYTAARDATFLQIVEIALVACAKDIITEPATTANHLNRVGLARDVLRSATAWAVIFADGVALQGITNVSTDPQFYSAVAAVWNGYAGVIWNGALSA
jgi:hypothetical protein